MKKTNYASVTVMLLLLFALSSFNVFGQNCPPPTITCPQNIELPAFQENCIRNVTYPAVEVQIQCPCVPPTYLPGFSQYADYNNHRYFVSFMTATWVQANQMAQQLGGHLVTISSAEENNFVSGLITIGQDFSAWIGLREVNGEGDWQWVTGEPFTYQAWNWGEPNNSGGIETYVEMYGDGPWNDLSPDWTKRFIVEFECPVLVQTAGLPSGSDFPVGTTTNTFSFTDNYGQTATCSFDVTILDNIPPTITCPGDLTYHCPDQVNYPLPVAYDNCYGSGEDYMIDNCNFSLFDMSNSTYIGGCDDCLFSPLALPFDFIYYETAQSAIRISTNGFVSFDSEPVVGSGCCSGQQLPNSDFGNSIAVGWTDLVTNVRYKVFGNSPSRIFVVDWNGHEFATESPQHIQLALYEGSNEIRIISDFQTSVNHSRTMGINKDGVTGMAIPGRNAQLWNAYQECISFSPSLPVTLVSGIPTGGAFPPGTTTLVYSATDESGNTSSCSFNITIVPYMTGSFTVGEGGDFTTLTGEDGLFDSINAGGICGVTARIISDLIEPGTIALNEFMLENPDNNHLTIVPDDYGYYEIKGNVANALIRFNGADNVRIIGSSEYYGYYEYSPLYFENQNPAYPTLQLTNGSMNNLFRGCTFAGTNLNSASGVVVLGTSTESDGNSYNNFEACQFFNGFYSSAMPFNLFYSGGTVGTPNKDNNLYGNLFTNFNTNGIFIAQTGNGSNWNLTYNFFMFEEPVANANKIFINFLPGLASNNNELFNNIIWGGLSEYSPPMNVTGSGTMKGIVAYAGESYLYNNIIGNIKLSNTGITNLTCIEIPGGYSYIQYNMLGGYFGYAMISSAGTGAIYGINSLSTAPVYIERNSIGNFQFTKSTGSPVFRGIQIRKGEIYSNRIENITGTQSNLTPTFYGICNVASGLTSPNYIYNNMIAIDAGAVSKPKVYGLFDQSIGLGANFIHNSVHLYGITAIGYSTAAFYRIGNGVVNLYNNILVNNRISNVISKHYALEINTTANFTSDYNDLYTISASLAKIAGTMYPTMTQWKMFTIFDDYSINVAPVFFSPTDLHLAEFDNPLIDMAGGPAYNLEYDFDNQYRDYYSPDPGADEFGEGGEGGGGGGEPPRLEAPVITTLTNSLSIYPNPFNSNTTLAVNLTQDDVILIEVFSMMGERVKLVAEGTYPAGTHSFILDGTNLPSGTYICRYIVNGKESIVKRMEIIK